MEKKTFLITGRCKISNLSRKLYLVIGLFVLILSAVAVVNAAELCRVNGSIVSNDLKVTNFTVTGPDPFIKDNTITVSFYIENSGQDNITLGSRGIFIAVEDQNSEKDRFGSVYEDIKMAPGNNYSISSSKKIETGGTWAIWPSYTINEEGENTYGPHEWYACIIEVGTENDKDNDGIENNHDNCPDNSNENQQDSDGDNIGDVCDDCDARDFDNDGIVNCNDTCTLHQETYNGYEDEDGCPDDNPGLEEDEQEDETTQINEIDLTQESMKEETDLVDIEDVEEDDKEIEDETSIVEEEEEYRFTQQIEDKWAGIPNGEILQILCGNNVCDDLYEDYRYCPEDCNSGTKDGYCDAAEDDICDPDCIKSVKKKDLDCQKKNWLAWITGMVIFFY